MALDTSWLSEAENVVLTEALTEYKDALVLRRRRLRGEHRQAENDWRTFQAGLLLEKLMAH